LVLVFRYQLTVETVDIEMLNLDFSDFTVKKETANFLILQSLILL